MMELKAEFYCLQQIILNALNRPSDMLIVRKTPMRSLWDEEESDSDSNSYRASQKKYESSFNLTEPPSEYQK